MHKHIGWLLRADNVLFSSETLLKESKLFLLRGQGDMEISFLTSEDSKIRGYTKGTVT